MSPGSPANQIFYVLCWVTLKGLTGDSLSLIQHIDLPLSPIEDAVAAFRNLKLRLLHPVHFILIRLQLVKCLDKSYSHTLKKIMSHNKSPFCTIWELKRPHFSHWEWAKNSSSSESELHFKYTTSHSSSAQMKCKLQLP